MCSGANSFVAGVPVEKLLITAGFCALVFFFFFFPVSLLMSSKQTLMLPSANDLVLKRNTRGSFAWFQRVYQAIKFHPVSYTGN